jgi:hypothetical protein
MQLRAFNIYEKSYDALCLDINFKYFNTLYFRMERVYKVEGVIDLVCSRRNRLV